MRTVTIFIAVADHEIRLRLLSLYNGDEPPFEIGGFDLGYFLFIYLSCDDFDFSSRFDGLNS